MKRLPPRELILLCFPLLLIGGVGFLLSRRPPISSDKSRLGFHVEKPTTLEAFHGIEAAFVVQFKGTSSGRTEIAPFFELQTATGVQRFSSGGNSAFWKNVLKSTDSVGKSTRFLVNLKSIPPGSLRFGAKTFTVTATGTKSSSTPTLQEKWTIHREQIKPLVFASVPRPPLVVLRSIKVTHLSFSGGVTGECAFDLSGVAMNAQTPTEFNFSGSVNRNASKVSSGWSVRPIASPNPTRRVWEWTMNFPVAINTKTTARASGLISVNSRWPLAFESESFDIAKAKVGQQLKFKTWPSPHPSP